ncbi:MAG: ATPase [Bacteroidales bacterium 36-12]|jgi:N-acetylglucosamine kinase-like BadF-type ATPase|nr:MAG: ATPase [Bacteroidales bacterium 36-12]
MIIIADGGSTTVDWCLVDKGTVKKNITTKGANPFFRTTEDISVEIRKQLLPQLNGNKIEGIYFYGAGCAFPEKNKIVRDAIAANFDVENIEIYSDLLGAAVGLYGDKPGIACILGTGSNSCFYDGKNICENVSPLGFILGDEGSGAVLGRLFVGSCLKNQFGQEIKNEFLNYIQLSIPEILDRVYKQPLPNRFLASISPFIQANIHNDKIYQLVFNAFTDFFKKNVMQYDYKNYKVSFIGSVAYHFQDILKASAEALHIELGEIVQSPMEGLVRFYA